MLAQFREFLVKSNALALAIGVIIGIALGNVVSSLVNDILMPPIGVVLGNVDFAGLKIVLKEATGGDPATEVAIRWGLLVNALISFLFVSLVAFWIGRTFIKEAPPAPTQTCPYCKETVAPDATKCKFCGSGLGASA
jgi:large conductance mechanosensitive channel